MKNLLDRDLIEQIKDSNNSQFLENINKVVYQLVGQVVEDISTKSPLVRPEMCRILPVNEIYTGAFSQLSEYVYFLGIENPQLETNTTRKKNLLKNLWKTFKENWRIGRKRRRKKMSAEPRLISVEKYQISDFKHDVMRHAVEYLSQSSIVTEFSNHLEFIGNEDFGSNVLIKIYVCCYNSKTETFKLPIKNKFVDVTFGDRFKNLDKKYQEVGEQFIDVLKIFNALYAKHYGKLPNQILLESLICGCPNNMFIKGDTYKTFVNVANYVTLVDPSSFTSICDPKHTIFGEKLVVKATDQIDFNRIAKMLATFRY